MCQNPLRLLLLSENTLFADAMAEGLAGQPGVIEVRHAPIVQADPPSQVVQSDYDVLLLHIEESSVKAPAVTAAVVEQGVQQPLIVLGSESPASSIVQHIQSGAVAYVSTKTSLAELLGVIRDVQRGESPGDCEVLAAALRKIRELSSSGAAQPPDVDVSDREVQILALVEAGMANKQIAGELQLSLSTVKHHLHRIFEKLSAKTRTEAVLRARQWGLLDDSRSVA